MASPRLMRWGFVVGVLLVLQPLGRATAQEEPIPEPPPGYVSPAPPEAERPPAPPSPAPPDQASRPGEPIPPTVGPPRSDGGRGRSIAVRASLYGTAGLVAAFGTVSALVWLDAEDPFLYVGLPMLGAGTGLATVLLLEGERGLSEGVSGAIVTGTWMGLAESLLLWGAGGWDLGPDATLGLTFGGAAGGALLGGLSGAVLSPSLAEGALVGSGFLWGGWVGFLVSAALDQEGNELARGTLVGANATALVSLGLAALTDPSIWDVGAVHAGVVAGTVLGLAVAGVVHGVAERRGDDLGPEALFWSLGIGAGVGLVGGLILGDGKAASDGGQDEGVAPEVGLAPVPGGGVAALRGAF